MRCSGDADGSRPSSERLAPAGQATVTDRSGVTRQVFLRRTAGGLIGFSGLAALLEACGSNGAAPGAGAAGSPPAHPTGTLRVAIAGFLDTFDPTTGGTVSDTAALWGIYENLLGFNADYTRLEGILATKWESRDAAREWRFTLREGVKFHDGTPFDAAAARKSFEYILRKDSPYGPILLGSPTLDDSEPGVITFRYKAPFPDLARNLTTLCPMISPKVLEGSPADAEKRIARQHVGTGPYRFASMADGQSFTVAAFDGYWGEPPHIKTIVFSNIPEESSRVSALQAGDVDLVLQLAPLAARSLASNPRIVVHERPTWTTVTLMPVCTQPPFEDVRVRQALAHAIDRKAIVEKVLLGQAAVDDSMLPSGVYGYSRPSTTYAYDPAQARRLLTEAGRLGARVRLGTRSDQVLGSEITQALVAQLNAAGFAATGEVLDSAVYEADAALARPKYDLHWVESGWVNAGPFHLTLGDIAATAHYKNSAYDALVTQITTTPDGAKREQLIAQADEQWARDAAWVTLWVPKRLDGAVASLQGYRTPPNVFTLMGGSYLHASS